MEVTKQLSESGSFMDYSQGPSNIDVHSVYNTSGVGASKGLLGSHNLVSYVLEGHNDQQYRQAQAQEYQFNGAEGVEVQGENQVKYGDAEQVPVGEQVYVYEQQVQGEQVYVPEQQVEGEQVYAYQQNVEGSSHVVRAENVERIGEAYQTEVDPTALNNQVAEFNYQQSSNLFTKQHELLHDGQEIKTEVVHQDQEVPVQYTENVVVPETVEQQVVAEQVHTEPAQPTEVAAVNQEGAVEQNQTQPAEAENKGSPTKGTVTFKPIEFKFFGEKNDKMAKVKPIFKAKIGGHHKASHAGKFENETFTWNDESVIVGYSNQDAATLEVKKAGMFGKTIASGKIALGDIISQRTNQTLNVQLLEKEKVIGELKVEAEFKPKTK